MRFLIWLIERFVEWVLGALILTLAFSLPIMSPHGIFDIADALSNYPIVLMFVGTLFFIFGGYSVTSLIVLSLSRRQPSFYYVIWNVLTFNLTYGVLAYLFFGQRFSTEDSLPPSNSWALPITTYIPAISVVGLCSWLGEEAYRRKIRQQTPKPIIVTDVSPQP